MPCLANGRSGDRHIPMTLLFSAPNGYGAFGLRRLLLALVLAWIAPSIIAAALLAQYLANTPAMGAPGLMVWAMSVLLLMSPVLSWLGLLLAAPFVAALMDRGWFGWIPALCLGLICGGLIAFLMDTTVALSFGAAQIAALRAVLGRMQPAAFELTQSL